MLDGIFQSKRFWLAIAGVVTVVLNDKLPISEDQIQQLVLMLAAWILGDSLRETKIKLAKGK